MHLVGIAIDQAMTIADALFHPWFQQTKFPDKTFFDAPTEECKALQKELQRWIINWGHHKKSPLCVPHPEAISLAFQLLDIKNPPLENDLFMVLFSPTPPSKNFQNKEG